MSNNRLSAFTLVELVVTIVILGILGTIAFISYGYIIGDSRNSKTKSQLSQLSRSVQLGKTEGISIFSFVTPHITNQLNNPSIMGKESSTGVNYDAGTVNYTAIGTKPLETENNLGYRIGVTKMLGQKYEISGVITGDNNEDQALIVGNYNQRTMLSSSSSGTISPQSNKMFILEKNNGIKIGDTITTIGGVIVQSTVDDVSNNQIYITDSIPSGTTHFSLAQDETVGLISGKDEISNTGTVVHLGKILPY